MTQGKDKDIINKILRRLEDNDYSAKFIGFSFTGGENLDTNAIFDINTETGRVGKICLGDGTSYRISFNPMSGVMASDGFQSILERNDETQELFDEIKSRIMKALERDDPDFIKNITLNGNRYMPNKNIFYANLTNENSKFNGYGEISRKDILSGEFAAKIKETSEYKEHRDNILIYTDNDKKEEEMDLD